MFDWLFEGRLAIYLLLGLLTVALVFAWRHNGKGWCLIGAGVMLVLIGGYWLLNRLVETDREEITRKVDEISAAVRQRDLDKVFANLSDQFRSPSGMTKQAFRSNVESLRRSYEITELVVWDFEFSERPAREKGTATASFRFKVKGNFGDMIEHRCEPVFVYEPPHGWRMKSFTIFKPMPNEPIQLPGT